MEGNPQSGEKVADCKQHIGIFMYEWKSPVISFTGFSSDITEFDSELRLSLNYRYGSNANQHL